MLRVSYSSLFASRIIPLFLHYESKEMREDLGNIS